MESDYRITTVAALVLVSNDEYYLPYVLESISGVFGRVVIYNVGSEDKTKQIIDWWVNKEKETDCFVRHLPMCDPVIQGCFRNSMIAEARTDAYWIADGDEILRREEAKKIPRLASQLLTCNTVNPRHRYGVVNRLEVSQDLKSQYDEIRTHHRLYTRDAIWTHTHPGERAFYQQNSKSEVNFRDEIQVLHLHNATRSSKENVALKRMARKSQNSYHPGKLINFNILEEYPILKEPIEDWPMDQALMELQNV